MGTELNDLQQRLLERVRKVARIGYYFEPTEALTVKALEKRGLVTVSGRCIAYPVEGK